MAASGNGCVSMPSDRQMYLTLFDATEKAIDLLIQAQQACEELYISSSEPEAPPESPSEPPQAEQ